MSEIKSTKDLSIFKKHPSNREIRIDNVRKIKNSLLAKNLLKFKPVLVDNFMRILDGQHRIEAAKQLGLEVWYQIQEDSAPEDIILINANQRRWGLEDYLNFQVAQGNVEYAKIKQWCTKHNASLQEYLRLDPTLNYSKSNGKMSLKFRSGTYKFPNDEQLASIEKTKQAVDRVYEAIDSYLLSDKTFIKLSYFRRSLVEFLAREDVDLSTFLIKLRNKTEALRPCATCLGYLHMFRDIYNWKNQNPIE